MSVFNGRKLRLEIYGGSHESVIGIKIEGLSKGTAIDREALLIFMQRRAPGRDKFSTPRKEADAVEFIEGVENDTVTGEVVHAIIRSTNQRSKDYSQFSDTPRPAHADYVANIKYGDTVNMAGGGPFSGRMTAPLCIMGGIAISILEKMGITVGAHLYSVGNVKDTPFDKENISKETLDIIKTKPLPTLSDTAAEDMADLITKCREEGDSIGCIIECAAVGVPIGIGGPIFDGIESELSALLFSVPAVKGVEFGAGFESAHLKGSENNDPFVIRDGKITIEKNNSGGILGGISSGMPIIFRAAIKPTPSISKEQNTVSMINMENTTLSIKGRHDPCIGKRAVPVIEAVCAIALLDMLMDENGDDLKWI